MADTTWLASTTAKSTATLNGAQELRVIDDPSGTPTSKKTTVTAIITYLKTLANTWLATQTITPAANTSALVASSYSLTGANAQSLQDFSGTWNTSGTPTAVKVNITDTASNANSVLFDFQIGGVSKFKGFKDGKLQVGSSIDGIGGTGITGISINNSNTIQWVNGTYLFGNASTGAVSGAFRLVGSGSTTTLNFGGDTSASPALKKSSAVLQARLADDSAFAQLQGKLTTDANATTGLTAGVLAAMTNASITVTDASGQVYRIPCII